MAKLRPIQFQHKAENGELLAFTAQVSVSGDGEFSVTLPDFLEQVAQQVLTSRKAPVRLDRPRQNLRVSGATLNGCEQFVDAVCKEYMRCDVEESLVIVYSMNNRVAYFKDTSGNFFCSGSETPAAAEAYRDGSARWHGTLNATACSPHYQVGLAARVFKKTTYARASGQSTTYTRVERGDRPSDSWLERLNGFVGLSLLSESRGDLSRLPQMPYTEEAARFFYQSMMSMCQLADRMEQFFGNPETVQLAIARNAGLLTEELAHG